VAGFSFEERKWIPNRHSFFLVVLLRSLNRRVFWYLIVGVVRWADNLLPSPSIGLAASLPLSWLVLLSARAAAEPSPQAEAQLREAAALAARASVEEEVQLRQVVLAAALKLNALRKARRAQQAGAIRAKAPRRERADLVAAPAEVRESRLT
jgi:hypothetical protein